MGENKHEKPHKRKNGLLIICCVLLVLAIALAIVAVWQKNNLEAVKQYTQYTQEELEQQLQDNDQKVQDILNAALEEAKKVDNAQQTDEILKPQVSQEPAAQPEPSAPAVTPECAVPQTPQTPQNPQKPQNPEQPDITPAVPETPTPETPPSTTETTPVPETPIQPEESQQTGPTYEEQLKVIVDKIYALRAEYLKALDDLQAEAVAAYKAIPKAQRTKKAIINFVSTYISKATNLEKQCDGKMDAVIKELTQLQKAYGLSLELVDTVKYTYANEKSLKKAWYMSELEKRGMI